jgi:hypothetical protein
VPLDTGVMQDKIDTLLEPEAIAQKKTLLFVGQSNSSNTSKYNPTHKQTPVKQYHMSFLG